MLEENALATKIDKEAEDVCSRSVTVNQGIATITQRREKNLGKMDILDKQFKTLCDTYKDKYGTEISVDNLLSELQKETEISKVDLDLMEKVVGLIQVGNIAEANSLLGVESKADTQDFSKEVSLDEQGVSNEVVEEDKQPTSSVNEFMSSIGAVPPAPVQEEPAQQVQQTVVQPQPVHQQVQQPQSAPQPVTQPKQESGHGSFTVSVPMDLLDDDYEGEEEKAPTNTVNPVAGSAFDISKL